MNNMSSITFKSELFHYTLGERIYSGSKLATFKATAKSIKTGETQKVLIRIPHDESNFNLEMKRESDTVKTLLQTAIKIDKANKEKDKVIKEEENKYLDRAIEIVDEDFLERLKSKFPNLVETIELLGIDDDDFKNVNVISVPGGFENGWHSLSDIHKKYPSGVDSRHMVWIFNRAIETLMISAGTNIIHNAVLPQHILLHTESHRGQIVDWTNSCKSGENVPRIDERFLEFYAQEIIEGMLPSESSDIYMLAQSMIFVLGGNPKKLTIPSIDEPMRKVLNKCLQPKLKMRYRSMTHLYDDLRLAAEKSFGPRKFVELKM